MEEEGEEEGEEEESAQIGSERQSTAGLPVLSTVSSILLDCSSPVASPLLLFPRRPTPAESQ